MGSGFVVPSLLLLLLLLLLFGEATKGGGRQSRVLPHTGKWQRPVYAPTPGLFSLVVLNKTRPSDSN